MTLQESNEFGMGHHEHVDIRECGDSCRPRTSVDGGNLAEQLPGVEHVQDHLAPGGSGDGHFDLPALEHHHLRAVVLFAEQHRAARVMTSPACVLELLSSDN